MVKFNLCFGWALLGKIKETNEIFWEFTSSPFLTNPLSLITQLKFNFRNFRFLHLYLKILTDSQSTLPIPSNIDRTTNNEFLCRYLNFDNYTVWIFRKLMSCRHMYISQPPAWCSVFKFSCTIFPEMMKLGGCRMVNRYPPNSNHYFTIA